MNRAGGGGGGSDGVGIVGGGADRDVLSGNVEGMDESRGGGERYRIWFLGGVDEERREH